MLRSAAAIGRWQYSGSRSHIAATARAPRRRTAGRRTGPAASARRRRARPRLRRRTATMTATARRSRTRPACSGAGPAPTPVPERLRPAPPARSETAEIRTEPEHDALPHTIDGASLAADENISRTKFRVEASCPQSREATARSSLRGRRPCRRVVGPVAVEPDHAPFDALAEAGKAAVLDDRDSCMAWTLPSLSITLPVQ